MSDNKLNVVNVKLVDDYHVLSNKKIETARDCIDVVGEFLGELDREHLVAVNINAKGNPLNMNIVSIGDLSQSIVHPRELFKSSILSNAAAVLIFHNHPSGDCTPSAADFEVTGRIASAGELLGIQLLDHVIVGAGTDEYYSFRANAEIQRDLDLSDIMQVEEAKSKYKSKDWQEAAKEKEERIKALIEETAKSYETDPIQMAEYFAFAQKFYSYSPKNTMLIRAQNEGAAYCKSYAAWKKDGVQVNKGEKGLNIFVPVTATYLKIAGGELVRLSMATAEQKADYEAGRIEGIQKQRYKIGTVFDIGQTDYPTEDYPKLLSMGHKSDDHAKIYNGIKRFSEENLGCSVEKKPLGSILLKGYYIPVKNSISINDLLEDTSALSTLSHELGHALLHNDTNTYSTARMEFEADAVSIMLQSKYGIELTDGRRRHLAEHFDVFKDELEENENLTIDDVYNSIFKTYRENIDEIDRFVQQEFNGQEIGSEKDGINSQGKKKMIEKREEFEL